MSFKIQWVEEAPPSIVFGFVKKEEEVDYLRSSSERTSLLFLDLDFTIIRPKEGRKFPINTKDWEFLLPIDRIKESLKAIGRNYIALLSNQKFVKSLNIPYQTHISNIKTKYEDVFSKLDLPNPVIFFISALADDEFRKPRIGMADFLFSFLKENSWKRPLKMIMIGDAAGRPLDHASSDYEFSLNLDNCEFGTEASLREGRLIEIFSYPTFKIKGFNPKNLLTGDTELREYLALMLHIINANKEWLLLLVGSPGSGKSFLASTITQLMGREEIGETQETSETEIENSEEWKRAHLEKRHKIRHQHLQLLTQLKLMKTAIPKPELKRPIPIIANQDVLKTKSKILQILKKEKRVVIDRQNYKKSDRVEFIDTFKKAHPKSQIFCIYLKCPYEYARHLDLYRCHITHSSNSLIPIPVMRTFYKYIEDPSASEKEEGINSTWVLTPEDFKAGPFENERLRKRFFSYLGAAA